MVGAKRRLSQPTSPDLWIAFFFFHSHCTLRSDRRYCGRPIFHLFERQHFLFTVRGMASAPPTKWMLH